MYWISSKEDKTIYGWSIDYQHLLLHAISKPSESRPYIYLQLSCNKVYDTLGHQINFKSLNENEDEADEDEKFVEVNLYVGEGGDKMVDEIFVALSECTSLHPCDDDDDDDNDDGEICDIDEPERKLNKVDDERFEDACEQLMRKE